MHGPLSASRTGRSAPAPAASAVPSRDVANNCRRPVDAGARQVQDRARRWLWDGSSLSRVQRCGKLPVGQALELAIRGERAHWSGLQSCGSVHACPVCSERIMAERRDELSALLTAAHEQGFAVSMITMTVRHTAGDGLRAQLDALNDAWAAAQRARATLPAKAALGFVGMVRRLEITDGVHGWHPHLHALVVHEAGRDALPLGQTMHRAFCARLKRHGVQSWATSGGLDVRGLTLDQALESVAAYATKGAYGETAGQVRRAAHEVAGGRAKLGRRASRSHWQNLDLAVAGDRRAAARVHEYERATKGRRVLTWTHGLRERFLIADERSDDEIVADNDGDQEAVAAFTSADWATIRRDETAAVDLLEVAETAAPALRFEAVAAYLLARELDATAHRPGEQPFPEPKEPPG